MRAQRPKMYQEFWAVSWGSAIASPPHAAPIIARFSSEDTTPTLIPNPFGGEWTRATITAYLIGLTLSERPILVGFDFPFGFPFVDQHKFFPTREDSPANLTQLWKSIAGICAEEPNLGGCAALAHYRSYFADTEGTGDDFDERSRQTERLIKDIRPPRSVFVGTNDDPLPERAFSGMRMLRVVKMCCGKQVALWPLERPKPGQPTFVETFAPLFWQAAGITASEIGRIDTLNAGLRSFQALPYEGDESQLTPRLCNTLLSAAALKQFMKRPDAWLPRQMTDSVRHSEGWIFGVS